MRKWKAAIAAVTATALGLLVSVSPAYAEGAGVSVGHSDIAAHLTPAIPPCAETIGNPSITLTNVGTIGVIDENNGTPAEYAGAFETQFFLAQHAFNPLGTFPVGSDCLGVPQPVEVQRWTLTDSNVDPLTDVTCDEDGGTYIRVTNAYEIQVTGTCTVTTFNPLGGILLQATGPATFVFTGNQNPCLGDFNVPNCEPPLQDTEFAGVYAQLPV